jgi:Xaa-Pro aminopeptidase
MDLLRDWLDRHSVSGALLSDQAGFAWITAGGRNHVSIGEAAGIASVLITGDDGLVITANIEERRLLDEELVGTGLDAMAYPWHQPEGRQGLHASLTRMVHVGSPDRDLVVRHDAVTRIDGHMIARSVPGVALSEVLNVVIGAYEAEGFPGEWRLHHQGGLTGYAGREIFATPAAAHRLALNQACAWNPSITRVKSEDTTLVDSGGPRVITRTATWPQKEFEVEGGLMERPAIWEVEG